ncbi:MAG TPA: VTT domain-containing protein [Bacteroidota bacterium]|nr:VTT domain-containing protein [Bacteroidota bacterium]
MPFDLPLLEQLVIWGGYIGLFLIIFAETGLLIGFFLPGDSLLVTAGLLIADGKVPLDILWLNVLLSTAAISGDAVGYWVGARAGAALYSRPQSRWFKREHLLKTREFYEKYGGITIVLARFMPFARTFAPVVAGVARMRYRRFAVFNVVGAIAWIVSMTLLGFYLGRVIPGIEHNIEYVIAIVVFVSILPLLTKLVSARIRNRRGMVAAENPADSRQQS